MDFGLIPTTKPYLVRAIHEWCTDQGLTPYLGVAVDASVEVPMGYVSNGQIVLNVSYGATDGLRLTMIWSHLRVGLMAKSKTSWYPSHG